MRITFVFLFILHALADEGLTVTHTQNATWTVYFYMHLECSHIEILKLL